MRESNFAFPAQNKASVCITSQLYDRRALDTTSPLPLFNSLTHLTYLTSTSPRIREIMTMDGGLERLVRILHDFCICPPPPENPAMLYGLTPPNARPPRPVPTLNPLAFDKHAAYRFSLAFQCVVNIGVRGSEPIRSRVVQAGTLEVVGCILEAWLANKGFAVGPSSSATGMPRETREQRQARRQAQQEQRQREEAAELARALQRSIQMQNLLQLERTPDAELYEEPMDVSPRSVGPSRLGLISGASPGSAPGPSSASDTSTDTSTTATPIGTNTPTGAILVPSRDRSGTVIGRTVWDSPTPAPVARHRTHRPHPHRAAPSSPSPSTDTSRAETETEDDGDVDMDGDRSQNEEGSASPEPAHHLSMQRARRAVAIVSDTPPTVPLQAGTDSHIIISDGPDGIVGENEGVGVEDGLVSLETNDDFAMGAPPGAPGAIEEGTTPRTLTLTARDERRRPSGNAPDVTPRAGIVNLPVLADIRPPGHQRTGTLRGRADANAAAAAAAATATPAPARSMALGGRSASGSGHHHRDADSGPYRDEDVLLSLQLLAYLSKYPHVRQAFYKQRVTFHPASANLPVVRPGTTPAKNAAGSQGAAPPKESIGFFRAFQSATGRGKEKEKEKEREREKMPGLSGHTTVSCNSLCATSGNGETRRTNVFSLVERFTFRPSSTETDLPNPPPKLPPEIQYWAGVIMRNACRKDDSRGGIRQCANMLCGRWETYPREFAKCRRCRKAKYCGKECQSTAWSEGHRFWCSAKDGDEDAAAMGEHSHAPPAHANVLVEVAGGDDTAPDAGSTADGIGATAVEMTAGGTITGRAERRAERERHLRERALAAGGATQGPHGALFAPPPPPPTATRVEGGTLQRASRLAMSEALLREFGLGRTPTQVPERVAGPGPGRTADPLVLIAARAAPVVHEFVRAPGVTREELREGREGERERRRRAGEDMILG